MERSTFLKGSVVLLCVLGVIYKAYEGGRASATVSYPDEVFFSFSHVFPSRNFLSETFSSSPLLRSQNILPESAQNLFLPELSEAGFAVFQGKFKKVYATEAERLKRFRIFQQNLKFIYEYNHLYSLGKRSAVLSLNEYGDLHPEEFRRLYVGKKIAYESSIKERLAKAGVKASGDVPAEKDWVKDGAVTEVKNQGACGSCWAFATTGALEGAQFVSDGILVSLSEQEFVDCDPVDHGCGGGLMDNAFEFAEKNAICTEESYAYHARSSDCKIAKEKCDIGIPEGKVTGFTDVDPSEEALKKAIAQQPVAVAVASDNRTFQHYHDGVITGDDCGPALNHGVLAVGYGTDEEGFGAGEPYYKVKNSWGTGWGANGYVKISRGQALNDDGHNVGVCGILMRASYPEVAK